MTATSGRQSFKIQIPHGTRLDKPTVTSLLQGQVLRPVLVLEFHEDEPTTCHSIFRSEEEEEQPAGIVVAGTYRET